ncbi:MAG: hypothetical protein J6C28_06135 [Bacilli bacterium]|nr:hypothetical protein [Bacilli bacterium]
MKKQLKIILIILGTLIGIILLDTLQARILKHSPIISWEEELADEDSYVDRGIIIDTFYCTKEKDIQTISWKFKGNKFTCPIDNVSISYLRELQNDIDDIIIQKKDYNNFSASYVDEENKVLIIELVDNSKEEQNWFKKNIMDSEYIQFKQGEKATVSTMDFYISKPETHDDIKFNDYYKISDRTIYLAGNIEEFYVMPEDDTKVTLKHYMSNICETFDESIKSITDNLDKKDILKDGGTTIYKSKDKDITMIVCKTIDGNKDIFIGDYSMNFDSDSMCK